MRAIRPVNAFVIYHTNASASVSVLTYVLETLKEKIMPVPTYLGTLAGWYTRPSAISVIKTVPWIQNVWLG